MALMAPEIILQEPGIFSILNYSKADVWAAGAIAYEIFGMENPFYKERRLWNKEYREEDLPELPENVPAVVRVLVSNMLKRSPNKVRCVSIR